MVGGPPLLVLLASALVTPPTFVRLLRSASDVYELQTASVTLDVGARGDSRRTVDVISTVHIADAAYYRAIMHDTADADVVLFELMTSARNLASVGENDLRLRTRMQPAPAQRRMASSMALAHQLDALPYGSAPRFSRVADVPVEQLPPEEPAAAVSGTAIAEVARIVRDGAIRGAALSAGRARRGPPAWQQLLRAISWTVPCPELSLLILDWSWSRTRPQLSGVLEPLGRALSRLDLAAAQRLAYAQALLSASGPGGGSAGPGAELFGGGGAGARVGERMLQRNAAAVDALDAALSEPGAQRVAILYGPSHLEGPSGLIAALSARRPDTRVVDVSWRPAFTVEDRAAGAVQRAPILTLLPAYLAVDALDWWITCAELLSAGVGGGHWGDEALVMSLYVLRHGLLYWALSRWALDWSGRYAAEASSLGE